MILATTILFLAASIAQSDAEFDRDNVVICLDASGSMRDAMPGTRTSKMTAAKRAIATVLETVPQETQVGLFVFSGHNKRAEWVYRLGERNDTELKSRLDPISGKGKTPLGRSLKAVADALLEQRARQNGYGSFRLLVVTDGQATDEDKLAAYLPDVLSRGIVLDVIGVDMKEDHALATQVHSYRRANDSSSLRSAITEVFAEVADADSLDAAEGYELLQAFPENAVQGVIDRVANRNDSPILSMRQRQAPPVGSAPPRGPKSVTIYGDNSDSGFGGIFGFFAGSSFVCFAVFVIVVSVFFRIVKGANKGKRRRRRRKRD